MSIKKIKTAEDYQNGRGVILAGHVDIQVKIIYPPIVHKDVQDPNVNPDI